MPQKNLANYKDIFQYVYSHTFPEIYTISEKRGIDLKSHFHILFKTYKDKQMLWQQHLAKQPINYAVEHPETSKFEQKPILRFDEFTDKEERELKEKNRKRRAAKKQDVNENAEKKAKKQEDNKLKESEMWDKLNELNNKFKTIKQSRKDEKKMSATIL